MMSLFSCFKLLFMRRALLALLVSSPLYALLGTYVIEAKMSYFCDAIGHSVLLGVAIGVLLKASDPSPYIVAFGLCFSIAIVLLQEHSALSRDTAIGVTSQAAMALGLLLLSLKGNIAKYTSYLVGDILLIQDKNILQLLCCALATVILWLVAYNSLLQVNLNATWAKSRRVKVLLVKLCFAAVTGVIVALSINWTGLLLVNCLLLLPAAAARQVSHSVMSYTAIAILTSVVCAVVGLISSYHLGCSATSAIVLLDALGFCICLCLSRLR